MRERSVETRRQAVDREDILENTGLFAEIVVFRPGEQSDGTTGRPVVVSSSATVPEQYQRLRVGHRQRFQQDGVDEAENRRVGTNTDRERDHRGRRETGVPQQIPVAEAEVAEQV